MELINDAGIFIYPLGACSILAVAITIERLFALRLSRVIPRNLAVAFVSGNSDGISSSSKSVAGRILEFNEQQSPDAESLKSYARLEVNRMERGIFLLEVVIGVAPLLGLLGTVIGLTQVFGGFSAETGLPEPAAFIRGIAFALNTTILGLAIAIPSLAAHAYLMRRVESLAARLSLGVQALINSGTGNDARSDAAASSD